MAGPYAFAEKIIRGGLFSKDSFSKKPRLLLVLKTGVAGFYNYVDKNSAEGKAFLKTLTPGTELMLYRDPENIHDQWAIAVYTKGGKEIGYVTRFKNETISRLMDLGKKFVAIVDEKREPPADPVERRRTCAPTEGFEVPFSIYLEEG